MPRTITISLPVENVEASKAFYTALGFVNNPQCSDETAAFMVWSETINVMLLSHAKWRTFTDRPIPPKTSSEVSESRAVSKLGWSSSTTQLGPLRTCHSEASKTLVMAVNFPATVFTSL